MSRSSGLPAAAAFDTDGFERKFRGRTDSPRIGARMAVGPGLDGSRGAEGSRGTLVGTGSRKNLLFDQAAKIRLEDATTAASVAVAKGLYAQGRWRSGLFESSWR
jgi:hypothetical protein